MNNKVTSFIKVKIFQPINLIFLVLLMKITAFQIVIFDNKSIFHILLVEFPIWAFFLTFFMTVFRRKPWLVIGIYNFFLSSIFMIILFYTRYFTTIPSYYHLKQAYQSHSVGSTVALLGSPVDFLFFLDIVLILPFIWFFSKKSVRSPFVRVKNWLVAFSMLSLIMTLIAFRYPLLDVSYFAKKHGYIQSQIVQMVDRSIGKAFASNDHLTDKRLEELKGNTYVPFAEHSSFGLAKNRHLFIIQVESLQEFTINATINGQEITPNMNALLKDSAYFNNVYQQVGAGNTSDAEWIMHTSLYPEGMDPTVNVIDGSKIPSLVRTLKKNGYGTATYHADEITYWSRNKLYPALGFDYVYTRKNIPNEEVVGFGPSDEVLFQYVESKLPKQLENHKLMYSNMVTLTSHTPFEIPKEMQLLDLPDKYNGTYVGNYLQSVRYTDEQIGLFINHLKKLGIYEDSVILIYGDHSGLHGTPVTDKDKILLKELLGHEYSLSDRFVIPAMFIAPGIFTGETHSQLGGQIDLMPTVLNLLGIEPDSPLMGHNLFQYEKNLLGMRYYMPGGSFISDKLLYKAASARQPAGLYDRTTMKNVKNNGRLQEKIDHTLLILEHSDLVRHEETVH